MYRKPIFWIIFALIAAASAFFCLQNFDRIMSFISLDITMDRKEALQMASRDSELLSLGPDDYKQAVVFYDNSFIQYYIELEGGGKEAYNDFLKEKLYQPYQWTVRHFKPSEEKQLYLYYTPSGEFYGFQESVPETELRPNLQEEAAREMAEDFAFEVGVDLENFELAETSNKEVLSGRIDHTFIYERSQLVEKARYRLILEVSGNKVSSVYRYMHIPEAFSRRYSEMRSANNTIASTASYGMLFFYGLLGIGLGSFLLLRTHYLLYKRAILWAFIVSILGFLASFNQLPISWMWYDTALSPQTHITQRILSALMTFIQDFILLGISFMAAESLTRKAFPDHLQFWKTLNKKAAPSLRMLGNTLGSYGMVPVNLAFVLGFYLVTSKYLGWWNPAGLQADPNFIAMPMPWLSVISMALHAGFWEEALFRAVPLAGMILIGRKLKKERLFLVLGLILQAVIFSAGHANYAAQPSYARVVELLVPSLIFAFLYLRFGLYTGIILHFVFDAVLMAMFIWIMKAPGIWFNRVMVLVGIFLPLLVIIFWRLRQGRWIEIGKDLFNNSWKPLIKAKAVKEETAPSEMIFNNKTVKVLIILGLAGIIAYVSLNDFSPDQPQFTITREEAIQIADKAFNDLKNVSDMPWRIDARIVNRVTDADKLVWQEGSPDIYRKAMGKFVQEPYWKISFRSFTGEVADRAENYNFHVNGEGKIISFNHQLPEDFPSASLSENEAKVLAENKVMDFYNLTDFELIQQEVSSEKLPERTDWTFTWKDTLNYPLETGEFRYRVKISGDKVMSSSRYCYVPEKWSRKERSRSHARNIYNTFTSIFMIALYLAIGIMGIVSWSGGKFNLRVFYFILIVMMISTLLLKLNQWQAAPADFSTSQPWNNQLLQHILGSFVQIFILGFIFAMVSGFLGSRNSKSSSVTGILPVILAAIAVSGINEIAELINPGFLPWRPSLTQLGHYIPALSIILESLSRYVTSSLLLIFIVQWLTDLTGFAKKKTGLCWLILFAFFLITSQKTLVYGSMADFAYLILSAALRTVVFFYVFRNLLVYDLTVLPLFMAVTIALSNIRFMISGGWSAAFIANLIAIILIIIMSVFWMKQLRRRRFNEIS